MKEYLKLPQVLKLLLLAIQYVNLLTLLSEHSQHLVEISHAFVDVLLLANELLPSLKESSQSKQEKPKVSKLRLYAIILLMRIWC